MAVGGRLNIGSETKTITSVGTAAVNTTLAAATIVGEAPPAAAVAAGRELDLERRGRLDQHARGHDLHPQDVHRRRSGEHRAARSCASTPTTRTSRTSTASRSRSRAPATTPGRRRRSSTSSRGWSPGRTSSRSRAPTPAARGSLIGALQLDGERIVTDTSWKALEGTPATPPAGWNTAAFDDSSWPAAFSARPVRHRAVEPEHPEAGDAEPLDPQGRERHRLPGRRHDHRRHRRQRETRTITAVGTAGANGTGITRQRAARRSCTRRARRCATSSGRARA